ncbi:hypothetical protein [Leptospira sp. B5-022]|uniref:hypothetical protein n=2 Tax=unclassified Leptospira TaxID=2633828 RepID=UPI0012F6E1DC|nr:hypothetical protein [Leptospira sp. B5-022]
MNRIDPNGHSWLSNALKIKSGSFLQRALFVSRARAHAAAGNFGVKFVDAGTWARRFFTDPKFILGQYMGTTDYVLSTLAGKKPTVHYARGGWGIRNSIFADWHDGGRSFAGYGVAHIQSGESQDTIKHEMGHVDQYLNGGKMANSSHHLLTEIDTDLRSGTMNYGATKFVLYKILDPQTFAAYSGMLAYRTMNINDISMFTLAKSKAQGTIDLENLMALEKYLFDGFISDYYEREIKNAHSNFQKIIYY